MLLRNTNHKRNVTTKFASLCVVISMAISAFCFPSDFINFLDEDTNNYSSETGEIERFASDCVITISRTSDEENPTETFTEASDPENADADESSTDENKDDTLTKDPKEFEYLFESEPVVTKISFEKTDTINTREDDKAIVGHIKVNITDEDSFDLSGISFLSEDPKVAKIDFNYSMGFEDLYYKLTPLSGGETKIYAQTEDGSICSEHIKVVVKKNEVEAINIKKSVTLERGESLYLDPELTPKTPRNKTLTWTSSDESVVTVSSIGMIEAVGYGKATITATSSNGVSASCKVTVSIKERKMTLNYNAYVEASNHVGNDWYHSAKINSVNYGESASEEVTLKVGDKLKFYCESEEDDSVPDKGSKTVNYTVTEKDLINGFTIKVDVYVKENRGRYKGKKAHIVYEFIYRPSDEPLI